MELLLTRHLWGVNLLSGYDTLAENCQLGGYGAIEVSTRHVPDKGEFFQFLNRYTFRWIPQIFSNEFRHGGAVGEHLESIKRQINECLDHQPLFFNVHSGRDAWTEVEAVDFYGAMLEYEQEIGIPISHETHRGRYFCNPWQTARILKLFPELKLTCDFSHWVCVCERLLQDFTEEISLAASHCHHIHARVGYEQGPQVPDPRAPEFEAHLSAHEEWWNRIWASQSQRGFIFSTLTPEFGPHPYLHEIPFIRKPLANLENICEWMGNRERNRFRQILFT